MQVIRMLLALAVLAGSGVSAPVSGQQQQAKPPKRPIIINDRSIYRPPPLPPERTYVGPGPTVVPPMERVPQVAPLARPPIR
jgi:hypothetical protein